VTPFLNTKFHLNCLKKYLVKLADNNGNKRRGVGLKNLAGLANIIYKEETQPEAGGAQTTVFVGRISLETFPIKETKDIISDPAILQVKSKSRHPTTFIP
jgi:hypothetical protein